MTNKIYVYGGIGAIMAIIVGVVTLSETNIVEKQSLDDILNNGDCSAYLKWAEEHIFDDDLAITDEQRQKAMELEIDCGTKAIENMFGNSEP